MRSARISRGTAHRCAAVAAALAGLMAFASPAQADFGVSSFQSSLLNGAGVVDNPAQAGAHPFAQKVKFSFNATHHLVILPSPTSEGAPANTAGPDEVPDDQVKTIVTDLPPGLVGNPQAIPQCAQSDFPPAYNFGTSRCPTDSQVGVAEPGISYAAGYKPSLHRVAVYNLVPPKGVLARIGFVELIPIVIDISLRTDGDYGLKATVVSSSQAVNIYDTAVTIWGVPADSSHDSERFLPGAFGPGSDGGGSPLPSGVPRIPFMSNPTRCGVESTSALAVDSWQNPGNFLHYTAPEPMSFTGCNQLEFQPTIEARPTTNLVDAPSGMEFNLHIPQDKSVEAHEDPDGLVSAHLKDAVVTLPEGMTVNPPSAAVLDACSLAQVGMSAAGVANESPIACPDASILGRATVVTPALDHPLPGVLYLAQQDENPFGSLLAMYLVIDDPISGVFVKLPGKVEPDPNTGRLTVSFKDNPQLPVEDLKLSFPGGPHAALKTPGTCGDHTTTSTLTPWSAPEGPIASPASTFTLTNGPAGGACPKAGAQAPNQFSFTAGTADPTAKAFTPFTLKLSREDGTQQLGALDATLPKGLIGKLAGIPYCSDGALAAAAAKSGSAELASSSCPATSKVGSVDVGAGAGPTPIYVSGNAYLAGPYKGAPLSLAVVTPAVAGPFDLGTVVVRNALYVDPETAQVHAVSDPLPTILQGIPLNLRSVAIKMDRPDFTLNPTNCNPLAVNGSATSVFNQSTSLSTPFQVDECGSLTFAPKLSLRLKGGTKRSDNPALRAVLQTKNGEANIARTVVALPHSEFLAQNHIKTVCTRVQFAAGAGNGAECPPGSIYGKATALTPLLDKPISGPVYLRSSSNPLPDLVAALHGQIDVDLVGRIDSKNGGIRTTFDSVPDAPVTKFVLEMQGGKKGLLENSRNLCKSTNRASVQMDAQNGKFADSTPELVNGCRKAKKKSHKRHSHR
jgi:hypothetical protein